MTREELLAKVNAELGGNKLTLSERTINEELDDSLGDFGDDEAANAKLVTRIANRLKRMEKNLHTDISKEVEDYKKNYKPEDDPDKKKSKKKSKSKDDDDDDDKKDDDDMPAWAKKLADELNKEREERKAEKAERDKRNLLNAVEKGLKDKFEASELVLKPYFVKAALSKLNIPEKDADVSTLIGEAEKLYNSEIKDAGIDFGQPSAGGGGSVGTHKEDEHEFDDIAKRRARYNPNPEPKD